jgi:hypothetical protein
VPKNEKKEYTVQMLLSITRRMIVGLLSMARLWT